MMFYFAIINHSQHLQTVLLYVITVTRVTSSSAVAEKSRYAENALDHEIGLTGLKVTLGHGNVASAYNFVIGLRLAYRL